LIIPYCLDIVDPGFRALSPDYYNNNSACDELSDITRIEAFRLLLKTFLEVTVDKYLQEDEEIESLFEAFAAAIPAKPRNKLLQRE
jgi:hypothetical protein